MDSIRDQTKFESISRMSLKFGERLFFNKNFFKYLLWFQNNSRLFTSFISLSILIFKHVRVFRWFPEIETCSFIRFEQIRRRIFDDEIIGITTLNESKTVQIRILLLHVFNVTYRTKYFHVSSMAKLTFCCQKIIFAHFFSRSSVFWRNSGPVTWAYFFLLLSTIVSKHVNFFLFTDHFPFTILIYNCQWCNFDFPSIF